MGHVYVLPNGIKANNMKEARSILGLSSTAFKSLVRKGIVIKKLISDEQIQMQQGYAKND
jgi:hypothetical protein